MGAGAKARRVYEGAVEYLCRNVEELRPLVAPTVWESAFPVVRDADPAGTEWRDAVRALHDAVESAGVPNGLGLPATMGVGDWPGAPTPQSAGWVCPTRRCARVELRDAAAAPTPVCDLGGGPMRLVDG
ncbi:hypothetical protein GCM10010377_12320 [Streptomyces viridiviolaceus]|uniref:Uncharacterized protein n=1 Tax=Streptomyces viridiviolaceus TaxID=68282 RepID=A0ABW2E1P6_9ACTN|nr:hypothetical protein [Streptomyces viridiviolaceus]GHB23975.1 hypothetical protein GCM10010377_12320 [Streptomyces viridiviolaceus]